ncbi:MAG TPA: HIT domain-containing protein [Bacillales bacterium]
MKNDWKKDRIGSAVRGENPMVLSRMRGGFAVIGDTQFLPGYCLLLPLRQAADLNDLEVRERSNYLLDMSLLGEAIQSVCSCSRINYSIYGNSDPFLHAHVFPRYEREPEERRPMPVWQYPRTMWTDDQYQYSDEKHGEIRKQMTEELQRIMKAVY